MSNKINCITTRIRRNPQNPIVSSTGVQHGYNLRTDQLTDRQRQQTDRPYHSSSTCCCKSSSVLAFTTRYGIAPSWNLCNRHLTLSCFSYSFRSSSSSSYLCLSSFVMS